MRRRRRPRSKLPRARSGQARGSSGAPLTCRPFPAHPVLYALAVTTSIVVNFDSASFVRRLLSSGGLAGTQVIVVDNGSEPDDVNALCVEFSATPVLLPVNVGFAAGVNAGIRAITWQTD